MLEDGGSFVLDLDPSLGGPERVALPHPEVFAALKPGTDLLIDDGKVRLEVEMCGANFASLRVKIGGEISDHKGVNIPDAVLPISPLTDKDRKDLALGLELGTDWVAASFVQRPQDLLMLREAIAGRAALVTKLEKPSAVERLDEIIELSDAIMVARGDLGVELPPEDVPSISRRIVRRVPPRGQAGDRSDPDARVDDLLTGADQSGSLRCCDRDLRRRRRGHALGRDRGGALPRRDRRHHASDRRAG